MTVHRFAVVILAATVLLVTPAIAGDASAVKPSLQDVVERLDAIIQRLDRLEQRIARLEEAMFAINPQPDEHGIIRDRWGRPMGLWGIDYPVHGTAQHR